MVLKPQTVVPTLMMFSEVSQLGSWLALGKAANAVSIILLVTLPGRSLNSAGRLLESETNRAN